MFPWKYRGNVMGEYHQQYVTMFFLDEFDRDLRSWRSSGMMVY